MLHRLLDERAQLSEFIGVPVWIWNIQISLTAPVSWGLTHSGKN